MNPNEARTAILAARCAIVYFTKRDGTTRRIVCHVPDVGDQRAFTRKPNLLAVWDVEKGAIRTVNLSTVQRVQSVRTRPHGQADRQAQSAAPKGSSDELERIAALFDNGAPRKGERLRMHA